MFGGFKSVPLYIIKTITEVPVNQLFRILCETVGVTLQTLKTLTYKHIFFFCIYFICFSYVAIVGGRWDIQGRSRKDIVPQKYLWNILFTSFLKTH